MSFVIVIVLCWIWLFSVFKHDHLVDIYNMLPNMFVYVVYLFVMFFAVIFIPIVFVSLIWISMIAHVYKYALSMSMYVSIRNIYIKVFLISNSMCHFPFGCRLINNIIKCTIFVSIVSFFRSFSHGISIEF